MHRRVKAAVPEHFLGLHLDQPHAGGRQNVLLQRQGLLQQLQHHGHKGTASQGVAAGAQGKAVCVSGRTSATFVVSSESAIHLPQCWLSASICK